jgi:hypothetical protein
MRVPVLSQESDPQQEPWVRRLPPWSFLAVGAGAWLILTLLLSPFREGPQCRDGWESSSIGRSGACSWHGGVKSGQNFLPDMIAMIGGVGSAFFFADLVSKATPRQGPKPAPQPVQPVPMPVVQRETVRRRVQQVVKPVVAGVKICPTCGGEMVVRKVRAGRMNGRSFWGCRSYPRCRGTRSLLE